MLTAKAIKGAGWLVFSRFLARIIDFFTLLLLARMLTPGDFGLAALAISLVAVVDTVLEVPVTQALIRLPTIDKSDLDTGFTIGLLRGASISILALTAAWPFSLINHEHLLLPLIAVLAIGPLARGVASPAMVNFARELGFRQTFIVELSGKLTASAIVIVIVLSGGAYWAIAANFVGVSVASTIASYILAPYKPALSLARLPHFAGFIGWFSSAQFISALNWQFDRFLIGGLADRTTLGRYAVASDVAVFPTQSLIGPAMQPVMAAFSQINSDRLRIRQAFLKAIRFVMLISAPACVGIALTADLATNLLLGPAWHDAAPLLSLLALAVLPVPYFQTLYSVSLALDRPQVIFRLNIVDLTFRIAFISLGFYIGSAVGAGFARIALSCVMVGFYLNETRLLLGLSLLVQLFNLWKIAVAVATMAIGVWLLREAIDDNDYPWLLELAVTIAAGCATYCVTLLLLGMRVILRGGRIELVDP
ncbi:oligosaccharide flippase family protein [Neorhizobium sp. S3-V5DH]|uniref:oligosaccharide flippase family protein n=1 Tax=Neorhizobium sp. S3-V5DH TaxID=2485166 RepID=UPI00104F4183|nr:oligosaccharide flippase family protein [Neorhizobium sp. S3-V5DH]TCV68580.1 PST family polysaccharide transporter [Neorhizobium sp. S3-V5DH]